MLCYFSVDFDYPDFDTAFLMTPSPEKRRSDVDKSSVSGTEITVNGDISGLSLPKIDRSTKPKVDRTTKINVTHTDSSQSVKSNSLYPDVRAIAGPANQNRTAGSLTNQIAESSNAANRPTANRNTDPVSQANASSSSLTKISSELSDEINEIDKLKKEKQAELEKIKAEHDRIILEDKARRARLKDEEEQLAKIEEIRRKEQKDVADLMRMKKHLQENIKEDNAKTIQELEMKEIEEKQR